jgi:NitT/TauT family transport system permease protein
MMEFLRRHSWLYGLTTVLLVLTAWQIGPNSGWIDRQLIPPASAVFQRFFLQWADPEFYVDLVATILRVGGGYLLAVFVGVPAGLAMGYWATLHRMFALTIDVVRPIPATALVPIAAIVFGLGHSMHISVVFVATAIPILLASVDGVRNVDPILINTARTLRRSTGQIFRTILLPAALPHIVTGLRIGIAIALVVGISSEMMLSSEGLGRRVVYSQRVLQIPELYAGVLTLATLGYLCNRTFIFFEGRLVGWHRRATSKNWS